MSEREFIWSAANKDQTRLEVGSGQKSCKDLLAHDKKPMNKGNNLAPSEFSSQTRPEVEIHDQYSMREYEHKQYSDISEHFQVLSISSSKVEFLSGSNTTNIIMNELCLLLTAISHAFDRFVCLSVPLEFQF